jgi:ornithine cyclodeaminase/alanine dehydrogenase-like protein (mu-crystallin family)
VRFVDADAIRAAAPIPELLDTIEAAYRDVAAGRDRSPVRTRVALADGDLLLMPGVREGDAGTSVKLVTVTPGNARHGLPTIHAVVIWLDARSGEPRAVLDGATVTAMRTGAASGVATRLLARRDAEVLALIGAGAQAAWQVRAVLAVRPIRELRIHAPSSASRASFAAAMGEELGSAVRVVAAESAEAAVRGAHVICCVTTATQPVFDAEWVDAGAHVNGIGAYRLDMVELPPQLFGRAALVAVDARAAALEEAGDLVAALDAGLLRPDAFVELGSIEPDWAQRRDPAAITVFKSVGLAIQDLATAGLVATRLGL